MLIHFAHISLAMLTGLHIFTGVTNHWTTNHWTGLDWTGLDWTGILKFVFTHSGMQFAMNNYL